MIDAIAGLPKVCEQVHMPVQVGDDNLLKRMGRGYTLDQYKDIVARLRSAVPDVGLTTDLMLGFPGETDEEFENTMRFVAETRYDSAFMFAYSPREGTKAAVLDDQIPEAVKMDRLNELIALQNEITLEMNAGQVGNVYEVLVERRSPKDPVKWTGLNRQGKTINFPAGRDLAGPVGAGQGGQVASVGLHGRTAARAVGARVGTGDGGVGATPRPILGSRLREEQKAQSLAYSGSPEWGGVLLEITMSKGKKIALWSGRCLFCSC